MAFSLAKYATKPNPLENIPLQTTRKENNWKTEEALARAAVTVETERIKGSNPSCFMIIVMLYRTVLMCWLEHCCVCGTYTFTEMIL